MYVGIIITLNNFNEHLREGRLGIREIDIEIINYFNLRRCTFQGD